MNGEANCILEICCPPDATGVASTQAVTDLGQLLESAGVPADYAHRCARTVYSHFDLAERGTLQAFKASVVKAFKNQ